MHSHSHHHEHGEKHPGHRFAWAASVNAIFVAAEVIFGLKAQSLALLADAGHNAGDVLGLLFSWGALALSRRRPSARFTYGLSGASVMAALANSLFLLLAAGAVAWEAILHLISPLPVEGGVMMAVAGAGILVNGISAAMFFRHRELNARAAFLHLAGDALSSILVVAAGAVVLFTGWLRADALAGLLLSCLIVYGAWGVLRDAGSMALNAVPPGLESAEVRRHLASLPGVTEVHDLHIWGMGTTEVALSAHLVMPAGHPGDAFLEETVKTLHARFGIAHATVQVERGERACALAPDHVI